MKKMLESDWQYHERVRNEAASLYTEVLPLSDPDRDDWAITIQISDDPEVVARFPVDLMDAAVSGDPSARAAVNEGLLRSESMEGE
jgi:hypothetical protein